jgi:ferric-dicitrate binding protein FerR (iron transport regulator)
MALLQRTLPALACMLAFSGAHAEDRIGATAIAQRDVAQLSGGASSAIHVDDSVFRDETVRTGQDSAAKFVFVDATNLALGPVSTVKLDRFVFNDQATYSQAAVNLAKGAFRFSSGNSPKDAYEIRTGNATIGVRGTVLDISSQPGRTVVTLVEGAAVVCPRASYDGDPRRLGPRALKQYHCGELVHPGDTIVVTSKGTQPSDKPFSFAANFCGAEPGLCGRTQYAGLAEPGLTPSGRLCGR